MEKIIEVVFAPVPHEPIAHQAALLARQIVCVTLGKRGVVAMLSGEPLIIPGRAVKAVDTTGAGDCFVGAVAAQLAGGSSIASALDYANAAASICVQRMGAAPSMPTGEEVASLLADIARHHFNIPN